MNDWTEESRNGNLDDRWNYNTWPYEVDWKKVSIILQTVYLMSFLSYLTTDNMYPKLIAILKIICFYLASQNFKKTFKSLFFQKHFFKHYLAWVSFQ